jgi:2-aminoethylphosphonate transport system permease protein
VGCALFQPDGRVCASLFALLCGMWAALSLRQYGAKLQKYLGLMFYLPSAIPSVSVGLGILVAFSQDRCR